MIFSNLSFKKILKFVFHSRILISIFVVSGISVAIGIGVVSATGTGGLRILGYGSDPILNVDSTSGKVGIGTSTPDTTLNVKSSSVNNLRLGQVFSSDLTYTGLSDVAPDATSYFLLSRTGSTGLDRYINAVTGGFLAFQIGGATKMKLDSSGNVGIGTAAPANALDVYRAGAATIKLLADSSTGTHNAQFHISVKDGSSGDPYFRFSEATSGRAWSIGLDNSDSDIFKISLADTLGASPTSDKFVLTTTGNVGIGNTSPSYPLDVTGAGRFTGTINGGVGGGLIFNTPNVSTNGGYFHIGSAGTDQYWGTESSAGGTIFTGTLPYASVFGNKDNVSIQFVTTNAPRMTILGSSGNVGIGTTAPTAFLQLGTPYAGRAIPANTGIWVGNSDSVAQSLRVSNANDPYYDIYLRADYSTGTVGVIGTRNSASDTDTMYLKGGNVGIGTTSPTSKLQVIGLVEYADNAAAVSAGLTAGAFYRTADVLKVVH